MESNIKYTNEINLKKAIIDKLQQEYGRTIEDASLELIYKACALVVRDSLLSNMAATDKKDREDKIKKLYYLSMEFLIGRSLVNNALNLMQTDMFRNVLNDLGINIDEMLKKEPEPGLGNGGLGRLAACFMDSLTTLDLPAVGCGIRYEYGLFKQGIKNGMQTEEPDFWLDSGNIWEIERSEEKIEVKIGGTIESHWEDGKLLVKHVNPKIISAIPYDIPVSGYDTNRVNYMRLWKARSPGVMDMEAFNQGEYINAIAEKERDELISKVLYPEDNNLHGKLLRLKQEYFLSSATVQWIIKDFKLNYGNNLFDIPNKVTIHINDTHPTLAIPELMRILMDEEGFGWDDAWGIVTRTFAYTNHTVMSEALVKWPVYLFQPLLPRIFSIVMEINQRLMEKLNRAYPGDRKKLEYMAIIAHDQINMANLCLVTSFAVNGVSALHTRILVEDIFADYARLDSGKFHSITNGITFRRWLHNSNRALSNLISSRIGTDWLKDSTQLSKLKAYADDPEFRWLFAEIKQENKNKLASYIKENHGIEVDVHSMFDVQAKRLHEYKRQLLNALHILYLYNRLIEDPNRPFTPRTFIFAAKAAPGYTRAKNIIRLINAIAELVNKDPRINNMIKVIFLENYSVSIAEMLIPATDLSEQISTAGKEASGTGNMKFMLNGALTIGSLDGANVEIYEQVGADNIYIFGLRSDEVESRYEYNSDEVQRIYTSDTALHQVLEQLISGPLLDIVPDGFKDIYQSLLFGDYGMPDPYMVIRDFRAYVEMQDKISNDFKDTELWWYKAILNTASAGFFSSDRTIKDYNDKIWHLEASKWS
ncbi:MAG: glycogen/starch/alpha-glucan phosphorylase [Anaerolineaceae bacterium]|nr:MAG: glycogen/starch/alpha-glucan phosphorylase [Anaerolineaceae bacterium]